MKLYRTTLKDKPPPKPTQRALFTVLDAEERGVHRIPDPLVKFKRSLIPGAGNGLFTCLPLYPDDVVTKYEGSLSVTEPTDPQHAIALQTTVGTKYLDEIRKPIAGQGLASFVNKESRDERPTTGRDIDFELEASFESFSAAVEGRVAQSLEAYSLPITRIDVRMHLRPSVHAAQKDLVPLTAGNFRQRIVADRLLFENRRTATGSFVCEVFGFVARRGDANGPTSRRATDTRITRSAAAISEFLCERPDVKVGDIARKRWAVIHARQAEGVPVDVPTSAPFRLMQRLDGIRSMQESPSLRSIL
ncbi:hypothetical protein BBJ28_00011861 [Nothophytophthora sp. Chile5]|nr:hypothetical protein BBJ28_00011861 [Nothophytophthora sp. Chile5]